MLQPNERDKAFVANTPVPHGEEAKLGVPAMTQMFKAY
jgi:hypothetical protein